MRNCKEYTASFEDTVIEIPSKFRTTVGQFLDFLAKQAVKRENDPLYNQQREMLLRGEGAAWRGNPLCDILDVYSYWNWKPWSHSPEYGPSATRDLWGDYAWAGFYRDLEKKGEKWAGSKPRLKWDTVSNPVKDLTLFSEIVNRAHKEIEYAMRVPAELIDPDAIQALDADERRCRHCGGTGFRPEPIGPIYECTEYGPSEETKKNIHSSIAKARALLQRREERRDSSDGEDICSRPVAPDHDREQGGEKTDPIT